VDTAGGGSARDLWGLWSRAAVDRTTLSLPMIGTVVFPPGVVIESFLLEVYGRARL
jgi:hypothetical protein